MFRSKLRLFINFIAILFIYWLDLIYKRRYIDKNNVVFNQKLNRLELSKSPFLTSKVSNDDKPHS